MDQVVVEKVPPSLATKLEQVVKSWEGANDVSQLLNPFNSQKIFLIFSKPRSTSTNKMGPYPLPSATRVILKA